MTSGTLATTASTVIVDTMKPNQSPPRSTQKPSRIWKFFWVGIAGMILVVVVGDILWKRQFHDYTPVAAAKDLRAAYEVRHAPEPLKQFLELRYGPQTDPANRAAAFIDFFNSAHIGALARIAHNRTDEKTRKQIDTMAKIIHGYRDNMSPEEKQTLADHFNSADGMAQVKSAAAYYQSEDARFRAVAAPVIEELMTTLAAVHNP